VEKEISRHGIKNELVTLAREARLFIQNMIEPHTRKKEEPPSKLQNVKSKNPSTSTLKPETINKEKKEILKTLWELHPMSQAEEKWEYYNKVSPFIRLTQPSINVILVLPEEQPTHRLFLENVSRVITKTFAPARVVLYQEEILKKSFNISFGLSSLDSKVIAEQSLKDENKPKNQVAHKIFLLPLSLIHKEVEPHVPFLEQGNTWIALDNLDMYLHDANRKRSLWKTIQQLFQS
jgi:hypothetical protein